MAPLSFLKAVQSLVALTVALPYANSHALPNGRWEHSQNRFSDNHWVDTWTSMPQLVEPANLPPAPFVSFSWLRVLLQLSPDFYLNRMRLARFLLILQCAKRSTFRLARARLG